jgi:hypothetical protein
MILPSLSTQRKAYRIRVSGLRLKFPPVWAYNPKLAQEVKPALAIADAAHGFED